MKFHLNTVSLKSLRSVVECIETYKEHKCTISINKSFSIELPVIIAASLSREISRMLTNDPTQHEFKFTLKSFDAYCNDVVDKIKRSIIDNESVILDNEEEMECFAKFGLLIGNDEFISPLNEHFIEESKSLSEDNVVNILNTKRIFNIVDISKETTFIAEHFDSMSENEHFVNFSRNCANAPIIESIITSSSFHIENEDKLLSFLLTICNDNEEVESFIPLFSHLYLEYCSAPKCEEFVTFVINKSETRNMKTLVSCIGRRLTQPNIPMNPNYIKERHSKFVEEIEEIEVTMDDPLNGILRREHNKSNVVMEVSSTCDGNVYDLITANPNADFYTKNEQNSFIKASLKDGSTFILKKYMIRGRRHQGRSNHHLQHWKIEGQLASNGEWIVLDNHNNEPFDQLLVRTFDISCDKELKAVKLTQTGKESSNNYYCLCINAFDIFGTIIAKQ